MTDTPMSYDAGCAMKLLATLVGVQTEYIGLALACLPTHGNSTYFLSVKDGKIFKRGGTTEDPCWSVLVPINGPPRFGGRDLDTGYALLAPEYTGAHWESLPIRRPVDTLMPIGTIIAQDIHREWQWSASGAGLTETIFPNGFRLALKEIPAVGILATLAPVGFTAIVFDPSGREVLRQAVPPKETAEKWVPHLETSFRRVIACFQMVVADADSCMDFGPDRRWESVSPESLAGNLVYASKHMPPDPLSAEEFRRLQELNQDLVVTGRFDPDREKNLSLDRLFAELIVRYLAFGVGEGVAPVEGLNYDFSEVRECILDAGRRLCGLTDASTVPDKEPT